MGVFNPDGSLAGGGMAFGPDGSVNSRFLPGPSQQQLNSFRYVYQASNPQDRQQILKQVQGTPYEQAIQGINANSANPYQVQQPNDIGSLLYRARNAIGNIAAGQVEGLLPEQTAGDIVQRDANGNVVNMQGGRAASPADVARTAIADRLMFSSGLPGLVKVGTPVEGNIAQQMLQRGLQVAPQMGAAGLVNSFNGPSNGNQFEKSVYGTAAGLDSGLVFGAGGELLNQAGAHVVDAYRSNPAVNNESGYLGGMKASGFKEAQGAGAVSPGVDGHPKFEVDDSQAKFTPENLRNLTPGRMNMGGLLPDALNHPYLYEDYPQLRNVKVNISDNLPSRTLGSYDRNTNTIYLNGFKSPQKQFETLMHETQHAIQHIEGHASGGSPTAIRGLASANDTTPFQAYQSLAGEAEARNVSRRMGMTQDQREAIPFNQTYDVSPNKQIVHYDNGVAQSREITPALEKATGKTAKEIEAERARMEAVQAPTKNQVDLNPGSGGIKSAIANSQMVQYELSRRGDMAYQLGQKLSTHDRLLARNYEAGTSIPELAQKADNPKAFTKAMQAVEDYYDYRLAAERAAGAQVPKVNNYLRHYWNLDNPEDMARFNELATQKGLMDFKGISGQPRVFSTYKEGMGLGFKPKNSDIFKDLAMDANQARTRVAQAALKEGIIRAGGKEVSTAGNGIDAAGKPFVNSNIPGLEGLSYSRAIDNQLKGYRNLDQNVFGKAYDQLNRFQKNIVLSLSLFHSLNISMNFAGAEGFRHPFVTAKGLGQSALAFVSPKYFEHVMKGFDERGVTEWATKNGISLGVNSDIAPEGVTAKVGASKLNPFTQGHKAIFEREIPIMTLYMAELGKKAGIEAGSAEGIKLGQEINNVMGLLNQKMISRDPNAQKWLNRVMLAPAFTETKYRTLIDAATKWGGENQAAGNLARQAVVGKTALAGLIGIVGGIIATGKFPTLQQVIGQATAPYIPTGIKNKAGGTKGAFLPHTFISELADPLTKLAHGDTSGVIHYANARMSPNLAAANKLLTNQDYFGNPIFDPNKPVGPQIAGQAVKQVMPIGVQNVQDLASGKKGVAETALNELGLNVKNDPNNPINQQSAAYFQARNDALAKLTPNQKADFNSINPATKNPDGSYTPEASFNTYKEAQKVYTLLKDPAVLDATIKLNQSQPNHDPMWDLPKDQLKVFLTYQGIQGTDYGIATAKEMEAQNGWIKDVNQARSQFFATLPPSQNPNGKNPVQYPQMDPQTQQLMDAYNALTDSKSKAQFLQMFPQLSQQFQAQDQYTQDRRAQQGVPLFAPVPVASPYVQAQMNAGNFRDPQVQQYLNSSTAYKASGPFGDGIQGAGGNHNTSQQALINLSQGLTASGKPSAYASKSASSRKSAMRRSLRNSFKETKYQMKQVNKQLGVKNKGMVYLNTMGHESAPTSHLEAALKGKRKR